MKQLLAIVLVISLSSVALGGLRENMWFNKGWKLYEKGNYKEAVVYFQKAAEQGHAKAQYQLGFCYLFSKGVPYDYKKANYWLLGLILLFSGALISEAGSLPWV